MKSTSGASDIVTDVMPTDYKSMKRRFSPGTVCVFRPLEFLVRNTCVLRESESISTTFGKEDL